MLLPHRSPFLCYARRLLRPLGTSFLALHTGRLILPNRRVRTRAHGGVTGKASDRQPMSIPWPALETRVAQSNPAKAVLSAGTACLNRLDERIGINRESLLAK